MQTPSCIPFCCCEPCNDTILVGGGGGTLQIFPTHGFPIPATTLFPLQDPTIQSLAVDYDPPYSQYVWDINAQKWTGAPEIP